MVAILPDAMFIGFTGTPLLKTDKKTSIEKVSTFIHTYKFDEAGADGVVLDLRYEPRRSTSSESTLSVTDNSSECSSTYSSRSRRHRT